jgi:predicted kinase
VARPAEPAARLVLVCGLPGAGKTTLARSLAAELGAVRLCPDEWLADLGADLFDEPLRARLERRLRALALELVAGGRSVVLEFGFWSRAERDELRRAARDLGVAVELRYLDVPFDELVRRVESRDEPGTARLTRALMDSYRPLFEPPAPDELALFDPPL